MDYCPKTVRFELPAFNTCSNRPTPDIHRERLELERCPNGTVHIAQHLLTPRTQSPFSSWSRRNSSAEWQLSKRSGQE